MDQLSGSLRLKRISPDASSLCLRQFAELLLNLSKECCEFRKALLFCIHYSSGSLGDEAFIAQLALALLDFSGKTSGFLGKALSFSFDVNFNLEHQFEVANDGHGRYGALSGLLKILDMRNGFKACKLLQIRCCSCAFSFWS